MRITTDISAHRNSVSPRGVRARATMSTPSIETTASSGPHSAAAADKMRSARQRRRPILIDQFRLLVAPERIYDEGDKRFLLRTLASPRRRIFQRSLNKMKKLGSFVAMSLLVWAGALQNHRGVAAHGLARSVQRRARLAVDESVGGLTWQRREPDIATLHGILSPDECRQIIDRRPHTHTPSCRSAFLASRVKSSKK